ncbi:hypothetical protein TI39_contig4182g00002 [Zymoseptoria brevis]|uniref:Uncharacterized protein n=1 Tax=Zymoseptoria brevis TaxID=1047168 RepID=A0A0F4GB09_9PEZI|nr:hypothetical protein TI39_contig4182g00002 [Zymoseptoria brevis]
MLDRFGMSSAEGIATPLEVNHQLRAHSGTTTKNDLSRYQAIVGCIMWPAQIARPDIAYTAGLLARYTSNPGPDHISAALRALRYLKTSRTLGISWSAGVSTIPSHVEKPMLNIVPPTEAILDIDNTGQPVFTSMVALEKLETDLGLHAYVDSAFANDRDTRRSTCGYLIKFAGGLLSWNSGRQNIVTLSSTEAEYVALTLAATTTTSAELPAAQNDLQRSTYMTKNPTDRLPIIHEHTEPFSASEYNGLVAYLQEKDKLAAKQRYQEIEQARERESNERAARGESRIPRRAEFTPTPRYTRKRSVFTDRSSTAYQPPAPRESNRRVYIDSHHHSIGTPWNPPSAAEQRREPLPPPLVPTATTPIPVISIHAPQSPAPSTTATITSAATTATAATATRLEPVERFHSSQNARRWMGRFKRQERAAGPDAESWIEAFNLLMEGPAMKWADRALKQWLNNPSDEAVGYITSAFLKKWEVDDTDTDRASILLQEAELQDLSDQASNTGGMLIVAINRFKKGLHNKELRSLVNKEPATKTLQATVQRIESCQRQMESDERMRVKEQTQQERETLAEFTQLALLGKPVPAELALRVGAITNTTAKKVAFKQVNYAEASSETFLLQYHQPYPQQSNYLYPSHQQQQQQQQRYTSPPPPRSQSQSPWHQPPRQTTPWQPNQGPKLYNPQQAQVVRREIGQNLLYSNNNLSRQNSQSFGNNNNLNRQNSQHFNRRDPGSTHQDLPQFYHDALAQT